jgi:hypothetical protein
MRLSKGKYLGLMAAGLIGGVVLIFVGLGTVIAAAATAQNTQDPTAIINAIMAGGMGIFALAMLCFFAALVTYVVLVFKAWSAIQDGQAAWSPAAGAVPLIIPIFGAMIWAFFGVWGWAKDYNKYIARTNKNVAKMPEGLFLAQPICAICSIIPILGALAGLGHLILIFLNAAKMCDGVNALATAQPMAAGAVAGK